MKRKNRDIIYEILKLGSIKEILHDRDKMMTIITYPDNGDLLYKFCTDVNKALENGDIHLEDLNNIRSGWFGNTIINLDHYLKIIGRELMPEEKYLKISCCAVFNDTVSQSAVFNNTKMIKAFAEKTDDNDLLMAVYNFNQLNLEVKLNIIKHVSEIGNYEKTKVLLEIVVNTLTNEDEDLRVELNIVKRLYESENYEEANDMLNNVINEISEIRREQELLLESNYARKR